MESKENVNHVDSREGIRHKSSYSDGERKPLQETKDDNRKDSAKDERKGSDTEKTVKSVTPAYQVVNVLQLLLLVGLRGLQAMGRRRG